MKDVKNGRRDQHGSNWTDPKTGKRKAARLYRVWQRMCVRADHDAPSMRTHKDGKVYAHCSMDPEWRKHYPIFRDWAMANGYRRGLSIDRIDNDKGYGPDNCRWVDARVQNRNQRKYIARHPEWTLTLECKIGVRDEVVYRWAKRLGFDKAAVDAWRKRMDARGWLGENGLPLNRVTFRATLFRDSNSPKSMPQGRLRKLSFALSRQ